MILILDIDGTLSNLDHRAHWVEREKPDWDTFLSPELVAKDAPIEIAQKALPKILENTYYNYLVTGRNESLREVTEEWLAKHYKIGPTGQDYLPLHMRPEGELSTSTEYKERAISKILYSLDTNSILAKNHTVVIIDDDPHVLHSMQKFGITLKAPECWELLYHEKPSKKEELWAK